MNITDRTKKRKGWTMGMIWRMDKGKKAWTKGMKDKKNEQKEKRIMDKEKEGTKSFKRKSENCINKCNDGETELILKKKNVRKKITIS